MKGEAILNNRGGNDFVANAWLKVAALAGGWPRWHGGGMMASA